MHWTFTVCSPESSCSCTLLAPGTVEFFVGVPAGTCFHVLDRQTPVYSHVHKVGMLTVPYLQSCITQFPYSNVHPSALVGMGREDKMQNVQLMQVELGSRAEMYSLYT